MKKKIAFGLFGLILLLPCIFAPFWVFSVLVLPLMIFGDLANILLPVFAICILAFSIRSFFVKDFKRFNNFLGIITLMLLVSLMNIFVAAVRQSFIALIFGILFFLVYWIYRRNDVRYYLIIFPAVILAFLLVICLWYNVVLGV